MNTRKACVVTSVLLSLVSFSGHATYGCRVPKTPPLKLVSESEFIVRVTAVKYVLEPVGDIRSLNTPSNAEIEFRVEEVLKGKDVPATLTLFGYLTDKDDYNDVPVPYDFVRPNGRGGSCQAYEYKHGAEFLLFLKKRENRFILQPYGLAPTNEQLRSKDDQWLIWVRESVSAQGASRISESGFNRAQINFLP